MYKNQFLSCLWQAPVLALILATGSSFAETSTPVNDNHLMPLEQIISQMRKKYGDLVVHNVRLTEEDKRQVRVVDFSDSKNKNQRAVIDARSGKIIEVAQLQTPMSLEKTLEKVKSKHHVAAILKTRIDNKNGQVVRIVDFIDKKHKRWNATLDAYTGMIIDEYTYSMKPQGKIISLNQVITKARQTHKSMVILKTRLAYWKKQQVREIYYLDESRQKKRLVVNASNGEVIEDRIYPSPI
ncbi:PepSY domain-containing protein [Endozoicomonas arenosclerae]|uniref:PepSY domain-containing protein n=1 Tax=Endozoicomonas arenosclerae TaxID=1633495 RepID=UPI000780918C|nr:PepSY domain-containing protein [Endozoicomonas arenosclerae]